MSFNQEVSRSRSVFGAASHKLLATWGLLGFILLGAVAVLGLSAFNIVSQRAAILADGQRDTANLARSLKQQATLTFSKADALLIGIVDRVEHDGTSPESLERFRIWFRKEVDQSSQFVGFYIVDSFGSMIVTSVGQNARVPLSNREYFKFHQAHIDGALYIGRPVLGSASGEWLIPVSRRLNRPDGTFGGVAVAAINPKYFQNFYNTLDIGKNGAVLLASLDGTLLVRRPFVESNIGRDLTISGIFKQLKKAPRGTIEITASTDGITRLNSYDQDETYPIVVAVAISVDEMLAPWRGYAMRRSFEAISVAVLLSLLGTVVWRSARNLNRNSEKLAKVNGQFYAALGSMSSGLSMFDSEAKLVTWNNRYIELYGMPPELIQPGISINEIVEHRKRVGNLELDVGVFVAELRQALIDYGKSTTISKLDDGRTISVMNTATADGGWVGIHEDITERTQQQQELFDQSIELAHTNMRFEAALSNMTQGISLFDRDRRLVVWNARYAEIYRMRDSLLKVGTHVNEVMGDLVARGILKGTSDQFAVDAKIASMNELSSDTSRVEEFADGSLILVSRQPTADGGWVAPTKISPNDGARKPRLLILPAMTC